MIPDNGAVTFLYITDKQYIMTDNYLGDNYEENEETIREKMGNYCFFNVIKEAFFYHYKP